MRLILSTVQKEDLVWKCKFLAKDKDDHFDPTKESILNSMNREFTVKWIEAESDTKNKVLIGVVIYYESKKQLSLNSIFVRPKFRMKGVATWVLNKLVLNCDSERVVMSVPFKGDERFGRIAENLKMTPYSKSRTAYYKHL